MNKKTLLLLASTVISAGIIADMSTAEAKVVGDSHYNGAIIRQLPRDNTEQYLSIQQEYSGEDKIIDRQIELIRYYEKNHEYEESDNLYDELIGMLKDLDGKEQVEQVYKVKLVLDNKLMESPTSSRAYYRLYLWEKNFGLYEKAVDYFKQAVTLERGNVCYQYEYAMIVLNQNQYDKAIAILELLKKQYPRELDFRLGLAKAYTQAGKYDDAIREYRVASAFDPSDNDTIAAINELSGFARIVQNSKVQYHRSVMSRPVASPDGQRLVAFNAPENQLSQKEKELQENNYVDETTTPKSKTFAVSGSPNVGKGGEYPAVKKSGQDDLEDLKSSKKHNKKAVKNAPGSKRVMVSYINGRKVVKIVNINTEADTKKSLEEASLTFTNQLEESNTGYSNAIPSTTTFEQPVLNNDVPVSDKKVPSSVKSSPAKQTINPNLNQEDYPSKSKYQVDEENNRFSSNQPVSEINENGDPNVSALSANNNSGKRQLMVSYKNGKKVVQVVGPGGTPVQQTKSEKKSKKSSAKKSEKNVNEQPAVQTQQTSAQNTDLYIKANELMAQNQYSEVINVLQNVQPPTLRSLTSIASCYNALGQTDTAIDYYKKADKLSPNNTQILYSIGYLYFSKNDTASAKKYVDLSLKADPSNANATELSRFMSQQDSNDVMNLAVSYMNQNNYSEAKKTLEKIVKDNPADFQAYYYLGHIGYATQKFEDAVKNFSMAIKYNPEYALSYYSIGLAFDKLREFSKSRSAYEQFLQMENDDNKYTQYAKSRISTIKSKQ